MGGQELAFVKEAFETNYIAPSGPQIDAFEEEFAKKIGIPHTIAVSSGTAAMHLAVRILGVGPGDEVISPSLTFIGGVSPVVFQGASLSFIDSDRESWNMDVELLYEEIDTRQRNGRLPRAVISTDIFGQCADLDTIVNICSKYNIPVISDSAEALGATYKGRSAGAGARAAIYSFNGNKIITTSGGGMLASCDKEIVTQAKFLSQQARDSAPHYEHSQLGYNYRMSNIAAAIGRGQLRVLEERVRGKRDIFRRYQESLADMAGIEFMPEAAYGRSSRWLTIVLINPQEFGADREEVRFALEKENIESRPVWKPMHMQPVFKGCRMREGQVCESLFERGLCLPSGTEMTDEDFNRIIGIMKKLRKPRSHVGRLVSDIRLREGRDIDVLVVDDERVVRSLLGRFLRAKGYNSLFASNGQDALNIIRGNRVHLAILDIRMPGGIDGIETLKNIKEMNEDIAVILITGFGSEETRKLGSNLGAYAYIEKPLNLSDIANYVEGIVAAR